MTPVVRDVADRDWPRIVALEAGAYRSLGLSEAEAVLRSRAAPGTSYVAEVGGVVAGYLLALPYPESRCPDPATGEDLVHASANLHLHDLVVGPARRGTGLGRLLLAHLLRAARARAYERVSLVAVGGSRGFWSAQRFRPHPVVALPGGYGPDAAYLSRPLVNES